MDERKIVKGFYECVRRTFLACRIAGYLPITGLLNEHGKFSRCVWISKYTIYYVPSVLLSIFFWIIHLYQVLHRKGFQDIGGFVYQTFAIITSILLIKFSFTWEKMIKKIEEIERLLPPFKNPELVIKKINRVMVFILVFGIVSYTFSLMLSIRMVQLFNKDFSLETYYKIYYRWLFDNVSFSYVTACLFQFSKLQIIFVYFFVDPLVIMVSLYLIYRFRNFNRIVTYRQKQCETCRNILWMDIQAHYTRLTRLVKIIDDHINPFVFFSFLSNLVFTCKCIYDVIQIKEWSSVSFDWIVNSESIVQATFLAFRISAVSILTAHIHTLSREPLKLLHILPDSAYTLEVCANIFDLFKVQRFMDQVYHTKITLSGFGFFHITRGTILAMISTIITYELVLLQQPVIYYSE